MMRVGRNNRMHWTRAVAGVSAVIATMLLTFGCRPNDYIGRGSAGGCSVENQDDDTVLVTCGDGTSEILHHGKDGASCRKEPFTDDVGSGIVIYCPDDMDHPLYLYDRDPEETCTLRKTFSRWQSIYDQIPAELNTYLVCGRHTQIVSFPACPVAETAASCEASRLYLDPTPRTFSCVADGDLQEVAGITICSGSPTF